MHANFPDAVVVSEWEDFDIVLDVCTPALEDLPDIRHAVRFCLCIENHIGKDSYWLIHSLCVLLLSRIVPCVCGCGCVCVCARACVFV